MKHQLFRVLLSLIAIIALVWAAVPASPVAAAIPPTIRYVDCTATGANNGTSWTNAYTSLQVALTAALTPAPVGNYELWVAECVYYPGTAGARTATFQLRNFYALYGGFDGTETLRTQRDPLAHPSILSGDIDANDTNTDGNFIAETWTDIQGSNAYHVVTGDAVSSSAVLDGFIITGGQADGTTPHDKGGGLTISNAGGPTLTNLIFSGNLAADAGGGLYIYLNSHPALTNITINANSATDGGGIYIEGSYPSLSKVTISNNQASGDGGGMHNLSGSSTTLANVTISTNSAANNGGGIFNNDPIGVTSLVNVTISNNTATSGGGIYNSLDSTINLTSTLIAYSLSGGDCVNAGTIGTNVQNLIEDNSCSPAYSGDPLLDPLADNGGPTLTHALLSGSPAIDTGNAAACPTTDQRGVSRPLDGNADGTATCDIGAVEAGTMQCGIIPATEPADYTFGDIVLHVNNDFMSLNCLTVTKIPSNHNQAANSMHSGVYWQIEAGLMAPNPPNAIIGYNVNVTLPHSLADPSLARVCKYPGSLGGAGWDCAATSYTTTTVTRNGITSFSDWAVGDNAGPSAISLNSLSARSEFPLALAFAGLLALTGVVVSLRKRR